ncbi:hypothetical protein DDE82_007679 [Stemphylium lycopersici]|nr:hypothetical protein TW65_01695 [Stemphylium lycopersici]RAR00013.1 hypothetical protein DDE82_007679 [Stemphylium lycopersici]
MTNVAQHSSAKQASSARPAEPILASQLISDEELDDLLETVCNSGLGDKTSEKERLGTGVKSLDDTLGGGFESGRIIAISGEAGAGANEICSTLLVSCLLQHENSTAAVVDTTGNFDIMRLYTLIVAGLTRKPDTLASLCSTAGLASGASTEHVAAKVLDRVKIMRVFDFVGVKEAVEEIRDEMEGGRSGEVIIGEEEKSEKRDEQPVGGDRPPEKQVKAKRTFVADSEDEADEEDMLFESEAATTTTTTVPTAPAVQATNASSEPEQQAPGFEIPKHASDGKPGDGTQNKVKFILIDNLSQVLDPLLKKDAIQGYALASTFLPALATLTKTHALHTMLANPATLPRTTITTTTTSPTRTSLQPPSYRSQAALREQQQYQQREAAPHPSMFASNRVVPGCAHVG